VGKSDGHPWQFMKLAQRPPRMKYAHCVAISMLSRSRFHVTCTYRENDSNFIYLCMRSQVSSYSQAQQLIFLEKKCESIWEAQRDLALKRDRSSAEPHKLESTRMYAITLPKHRYRDRQSHPYPRGGVVLMHLSYA
jgi:hypothetical protein